MNSRLAKVVQLCLFAATAALAAGWAQPAIAQSFGDFAENGGVAAVANGNVLREELRSHKAARDAAKQKARHQALAQDVAKGAAPSASAAPADDTPTSLETPKPGFLHPNSPGLAVTADISSSFADGKTGYPQNSLPGGFDLAAYIAPLPYTRIFAGYYEESFYPPGFDEGVVPTYVQNSLDGFNGGVGRSYCGNFGPSQANLIGVLPNCNTDLANVQNGANLHFKNDATTRQRVFILSEQNIIYIGGLVPIVISPTYATSKADVAGGTDFYPAYDPVSQTYQFVHLRSNQVKQVLFSLPFADSVKLFGVYTIGPQWNVNNNGYNTGNGAQIFQVMDLRYYPNDLTTFYIQPSILQSYYPVDKYPQRTFSIITGFQHKIGGPKSPLFMQALLETGAPTNPPYGHSGRIGVIDVTCVKDFPNCIQNPDPKSNIAATYGGFRASTFQVQLGVGNPSVIPL